jgi:hypothetical protein
VITVLPTKKESGKEGDEMIQTERAIANKIKNNTQYIFSCF